MSEEDQNTDTGDKSASGDSKKFRKISDADYASAKEAYELGKGLTEIADGLGVSRQALWKRFSVEGVKRGSRKEEVAAATGAAIKEAAVEAAVSAERFELKRSEWIEETRVTGYNSLKQTRMLARKVIADAIRSGKPVSSVDDELKTIQRLNKILVDNIDASLDVLRANEFIDEGALPSLIIEDLTEEEILEHHKLTGALPEDATLEDLNAGDLGVEDDLNLDD